MKKFILVAIFAAVLTSCGGASQNTEVTADSAAVDTVVVDTVVADSLVVDTITK